MIEGIYWEGHREVLNAQIPKKTLIWIIQDRNYVIIYFFAFQN